MMIEYSVIVPFYKGNQYIKHIFNIFENNVDSLRKAEMSCESELLIVNDSPDCQVDLSAVPEKINLRIINMQKNSGIHKARVTGLMNAVGKYILFLDQDDDVTDDFLVQQRKKIGDADVVVSNAWMEKSDGSKMKLYKSDNMMKKILNKNTYIFSHNQIASPGQCLIKRQSIPIEWTTKILNNNGSDDLFLWLLMFAKQSSFVTNDMMLYTHRYTGENLSESVEKMSRSSLEFTDFLEGISYFDNNDRRKLIRSRRFDLKLYSDQYMTRALGIISSMDILLRRIIWKLRYR